MLKTYKNKIGIFLGLFLTFSSGAVFANRTVDVIFFNDFHGQVLENKGTSSPGMAKFARAVHDVEAKHPNYILVAGGDNYQGQAVSNLNFGAPVNEMMNYLGVTVSAVGNHDFDWGAWRIADFAKDGGFSFVGANVMDRSTGQLPGWVKPYIMVERNGEKIAFIGLLTQDTPATTQARNFKAYALLDNAKTLQYWIDYLSSGHDSLGKPNAIIALTHIPALQLEKDGAITGDEIVSLLNKTHGLTAFLSAHSHKLISGKINGVPVLQAGYYGGAIGDLTLVFDDDGKVLSVTPTLNVMKGNLANLKSDAKMAARAKFYKDKLSDAMDHVLGKATVPFEFHDRATHLTPLGVFVTEKMQQAGKTQVAILNGGGIRQSLAAGEITVSDVYDVFPFDNYLVTCEISGFDLKRILEHGLFNPEIGGVQFAGLKIIYDPKKTFGKHIVKITLTDGTPIVDDKYYSVTTLDFLMTGGDAYDFSRALKVRDTGKLLRDAVADAIYKAKVIAPKETTALEPVG